MGMSRTSSRRRDIDPRRPMCLPPAWLIPVVPTWADLVVKRHLVRLRCLRVGVDDAIQSLMEFAQIQADLGEHGGVGAVLLRERLSHRAMLLRERLHEDAMLLREGVRSGAVLVIERRLERLLGRLLLLVDDFEHGVEHLLLVKDSTSMT